MRFMMFMIPPEYQTNTPANKKADENFAPPAEAVEEMKLIKAGKKQARNAEDFLNEL